MSKKDFVALADALRPHWASMTDATREAVLEFCQSRNPAFKRSRFVDYIKGLCGPSGGRVPHKK